jgi:pyruvate formate lyase activating enzyme
VDIKDMNPEIYEAYTGRNNERVLSNLRILLEEKGPESIYVRVPKIPEHNTKKDLEHSVHILQEMGFTNIEVFSYVIKEEK